MKLKCLFLILLALWDAAGKQDLYISQGSGAPVALTDFPVDSEILTSNITRFNCGSR
jgi:hypothetical protein